MYSRFYLPLLALCSFLLSCEPDQHTLVSENEQHIQGITQPVQVSLSGQLRDNHGNSVANALISAGDKQTQSNEEGFWSIRDVILDAHLAHVRFESPSHAPGSRSLQARHGGNYDLDVELIVLENYQPIASGQNQQIRVPETEVNLDIPANGFEREDGSAPVEPLSLFSSFLDPSAPRTLAQMPGDLRGQITMPDGSTELSALVSYGMLYLEARDATGALLRLREGSNIEISVPIDETMQATAPTSAPIWDFSRAGFWRQAGLATRNANNFDFNVSRLGWKNIDVPIPSFQVCGAVSLINALTGKAYDRSIDLRISCASPGLFGARTDSSGRFCALLGWDDCELRVLDGCGNTIITENIQQFNGGLRNLNILRELEFGLVTVKGTAEMDGQIIRRGTVRLEQDNGPTLVEELNPDGSFDIQFLTCSTGKINMTFRDLSSGKLTQPYELDWQPLIDLSQLPEWSSLGTEH